MSDTSTSTSENDTLRQYDLTLSTTTLSVSIDIALVLSWVNAELQENYIDHDTLSTIRNLDTDWHNGRAFLCLAHRFYPTFIPRATFDSLLEQDDGGLNSADIFETRSSLAFSVFEKELDLAPPTLANPHTPLPLYITKVRQALQSITQLNDDIWTQRTDAVLSTIQHSRQLLHQLDFRPSSHDDSLENTNSPSTPGNELGYDNDKVVELSDTENENINATTDLAETNSWEDDLNEIEQKLVDLHRLMDEYHAWANDNMDGEGENVVPTQLEKRRRLGLIQSVDNAHLSLEEYLEHGQQVLAVFRKRALFTQATSPIRQDLDWVQAEMLKTTTTDTGIKELEARVTNAGTLLQQLMQQYSQQQEQASNDDSTETHTTMDDNNKNADQYQQPLYATEVNALEKKYKLVQSWVEDVRVWFVEAQRIRKWIGERIDILEKSEVPDGVLVQQLTVTADHVEDLNTNHEILEKEVELFDKEDMSRLRTHVKDLTVVGTKEKDLSPADTTTIEITFTTLMTLDRLMHLLNRRSYDLQVLTLRVFWENEFVKTDVWVQASTNELSTFIVTQARWQADDALLSEDPHERKVAMVAILSQSPSMKSAVIDKLLELETDISTFDQGQFTTTVNLYQELDDTSKVELPDFLETRQVGVEESFEDLVHRTTFARHVVEQYLAMVDFMDTSGNLLYCYGYDLYEKLLQHTGKVYTLFLDQQNGYGENDGFANETIDAIDLGVLEGESLVNDNAYYQEYAVRLITDMAGLIPYTETTHDLDQQENEAGNDRVHLALKSRSSELILYGESLEYRLAQYQKAIRWHAQLNTVYDELQHIQNRITNDISSATDISCELTTTFGDEISVLPDELIHDKNTAIHWNHELQLHVDSISTYEVGLGSVDDDIQGLLDFYEQTPSTTTLDMYIIPTAVMNTVKYLETGAELASSQLQRLASVLDQWKSGLSMMKNRQYWESQYLVATEWMISHEKKCQRIQTASAWTLSEISTTQQKNRDKGLGDSALTLEQEWIAFKKVSLSSLSSAFEKLAGYSFGRTTATAWMVQRQRQNTVMSKAEKIDDILTLVKALLDQRMAITRFLERAETIQSQGTQQLKHLKWTVTKHEMYRMTGSADNEQPTTVDTYNKFVTDLWNQWQSFDNRGIATSAGANQEGLTFDLNQQCSSLEAYASEKHHLLLSLGYSLRDWEDADKEATAVRHAIKVWCEKVQLLYHQADDLYETLVLERDPLVERLVSDCVVILDGNDKTASCDLVAKDANQHTKDTDRLLHQWMEHDFDSLYADGLNLDARAKHLMEKLCQIAQNEDENVSLDMVDDMKKNGIQLDKLKSRVASAIQPIMKYVHVLVETFDKRCIWEPIYLNMSRILERLQVRLDDVSLDIQHWLSTIRSIESLTSLHGLISRVNVIATDLNDVIYSDDGHGLFGVENDCYINMAQSYHGLMTDSTYSNSVQLPTDIELKHGQCQQSAHDIKMLIKQLGENLRWLEAGATWIICAGEQLETWEALMGDLDQFIDSNAKWSIGTDGDVPGQLETNSILLELQQRVNGLDSDIQSALATLQTWKSSHSSGSVDDPMEFDVWNQKAFLLESCLSDSNDYFLYASNLVEQQIKLQGWSTNVNQGELLGKQAKVAMLLDHDNNVEVTGEPLRLLAAFDEKLAHILELAQNVNYPTYPRLLVWMDSKTSNNININMENRCGGDNDDDNGLIIRHHIRSQHEYLNNLSISLNGILSANERSTRLKSLVEGYVTKALELLRWISSVDDKLQQLVPDYRGEDTGREYLNSRLDAMNELKRSANEHMDTHYRVLMESADHCITAIQLDSENAEQINNGGNNSATHLDRVSSLQQQVEVSWQQLFHSIQLHSLELKKHIRQAEHSHQCKEVLAKCHAITLELDNANVENLTDDEVVQWQHDISDIKTNDLDRLRKLFATEDTGNLDAASQSLLDKVTMACQQLGNRLQMISDDVNLRHCKRKHGDLAASLIDFTGKTKFRLMELHSSLDTLPIQLKKELDDDFYSQFKERLDSIMADLGDYEDVYKEEGELFLFMGDDDDTYGDGDVATSKTINEQHQQVEFGWNELQQEIVKSENDYMELVNQRHMFDALYQVSSLLDKIDALLGDTGETDIDDAQQDMDQIKMLLKEAALRTRKHNYLMAPTTDDKNGVNTIMDVVYLRRYDKLLARVNTVENQMEHHEKKRQLQQIHQRYQGRAKEIKVSAQSELAALDSLRIQNINLPDTTVSNPLESVQQYQQWAKQVEASDKILQKLAQDAAALVTSASTNGLEKNDADEIGGKCQLILGKLKEEIEYEKFSLDLARRVLGLGKSANNITSWLSHFEKAVDGISIDDSVTAKSKAYDENLVQSLDNEISALGTKLHGFEPIMASLGKMNSTIQGISQLDGKDGTMESQWKHSAQNCFDEVNGQWMNCVDKLETTTRTAGKTKQAANINLKIESMATLLGDIRQQVAQLQTNTDLMDLKNSTAKDNHRAQELQLDVFKNLPRDRDISSGEEKLSEIKRHLMIQGRTQRTEINQLIEKYNHDQQTDTVDGGRFLEQQKEMDATWASVTETINNTKHMLANKKPSGRYLSLLDDIDLLLDSMEEVLLKADPLYNGTSTDNKPSKAELRAKLIELNARYNYYSINIQQNLEHADKVWAALSGDSNDDIYQHKSILENYRLGQQSRWNIMVDHQVASRQQELKKAIEQPLGIVGKKTRPRKASLQTHQAAGTLASISRSTKTTGVASSSPSTTLRSSPQQQEGHRRLRTVSSTSMLTNNKRPPIRQQGSSSSTTTASSMKATDLKPSTAYSTKKRSPTPTTARKRPNSYVAQAGNDLDMEIGRIVNDTPYRVKVKMVPGEVGRYWFGDINPKLVYCRVLKSKMVMVRVGGGWTELSQFLRDHALLEGELIIPKKQNQMHTTIQEGYLEATTSLQRQRQQLLQQHLENFHQQSQHSISSTTTAPYNPYLSPRTPTPTMKKSISTPPKKMDTLRQKGYKDGDKFFAVDRHGNQLEVKMTRFRQQGGLPMSTTNRRRKLDKS